MSKTSLTSSTAFYAAGSDKGCHAYDTCTYLGDTSQKSLDICARSELALFRILMATSKSSSSEYICTPGDAVTVTLECIYIYGNIYSASDLEPLV